MEPFAPEKSIHICHVGSRDSGWSDNPLQALGEDAYFTLFDADEQSVAADQKTFHLKKKSKNVGRYRFFSACLADKESVRDFYITQDPMTCGLLPFNEKLSDFMTTQITFNYSLKEAAKVVETRKLRCTTIDKLFEKAPDVLSLDAEGSEHDILLGSRKSLPHVLAVKAESLFVEYRKSQKIFTDVHPFLTSRGFLFVSITCMYPMHYIHSLDGARGAGFTFAGESLFVKDYKEIMNARMDSSMKIQKLVKLAAISLALHLVDYAYQVLSVAQEHYPREFEQEMAAPQRYVRLCRDFYKAYKMEMDSSFRTQTYFASNKNFWQGQSLTTPGRKNAVSVMRKMVRRKARDQLWALFKIFALIAEKTHYLAAPSSSIERVLLHYQLHEQAIMIKKQRSRSLFGAKTFARRLGLT